MLFAIVDIETSGGKPERDGMIEIAIVISDGQKIISQFSSLINPQNSIPAMIVKLTGITDQMVEEAPLFEELAPTIYETLKDCIFVAHNANFDYSWVRYKLLQSGFKINCPRICTVKTSRKLLPGHDSYSLGKLSDSLEIVLENRHRALGDALATTEIFHMLVAKVGSVDLLKFADSFVKPSELPPKLELTALHSVPEEIGVLIFKNADSQILWLKATPKMHQTAIQFANKRPNKTAEKIYKDIAIVESVVTHSYSIALLVEKLMSSLYSPKGMKKSIPLPRLQVRPKINGQQFCLLGRPTKAWLYFNQGMLLGYGIRQSEDVIETPHDLYKNTIMIPESPEWTDLILRNYHKELFRFVEYVAEA